MIGSVGAQNYEEEGGKLPRIAAPTPPPAVGPALNVASRGVLKVLLAKDGTSARGVQSSTYKAVTALTFGEATSRLGELAKTDRGLADRLGGNPNYNSRAGGVLLRVNGEVIGAIGVGGARGSENDEACALAGIEAVGTQLTAAPPKPAT